MSPTTAGIFTFHWKFGAFGPGPEPKNERVGEAAGEVHSYCSMLLGTLVVWALTGVVELDSTKTLKQASARQKLKQTTSSSNRD